MSSLKANTLRLSPFTCLLLIGFLLSSVGMPPAQAQYSMPAYPPSASDDSEMTQYNDAVLIDVLWNDYAMDSQLDSSTLTIVNEPMSGTADIDLSLGMILYTPNENFVGYDQFQYTVSDSAGNVSNVATVDIYIMNMPPMISLQYPYVDLDDMWVFRGTVDDENPDGCIVTFGGLLEGNTATADENGEFVLYLDLKNGEEGPYTAQTTDEAGEDSNVAEEILVRY